MSINNDIALTDEGTEQQCDDIASQAGSLALEWFGKEDDTYVPHLHSIQPVDRVMDLLESNQWAIILLLLAFSS